MSGINWDMVHEICKRKAVEFAEGHPNVTIEAAYFQGCMNYAAELESLRVINARLVANADKQVEVVKVVQAQKTGMTINGAPVFVLPSSVDEKSVSVLGSFM